MATRAHAFGFGLLVSLSACLDAPPGSVADGGMSLGDGGNEELDGGVPTMACGQPGELAIDTFTSFGNTGNFYREQGSATEVYIGDSQLVLAPSEAEPVAEARSRRAFNVQGSMTIEVLEMVSGTGEFIFEAHRDADNWMRFRQTGGALFFEVSRDGAMGSQGMTYSSDTHVHWRLRVEGTTGYWEVSQDGEDFTAVLETTAPNLSYSQIVLRASGPGGGQVRLANYRGTSFDGDRWCKASSYIDRFEGTVIDSVFWDSFEGSLCSLTNSDERAQIALQPGWVDSSCGMYSRPLFDLRDSCVTVAIPEVVPSGQGLVSLRLKTGADVTGDTSDDQFFEVRIRGGMVIPIHRLGDSPASVDGDALPYDETEHRLVRICESNGIATWEAGPGSDEWARLGSAVTLFDVDEMVISFLVINSVPDEALQAAATVLFDDLNAPD